jgi:hypothetical protein
MQRVCTPCLCCFLTGIHKHARAGDTANTAMQHLAELTTHRRVWKKPVLAAMVLLSM